MSSYVLPIIIFLIVVYGIVKKINVYESFINGTKEGFEIALSIFPSILAIIFATRIFISSGFMEFILEILKPILKIMPVEIFPMAVLRPISGNASLSLMIDIFTKYGPDSFIGMLASIIQGSTDTTIYVISLYFGIVGIKKTKHTIFTALLVDVIGITIALIIAKLLF